MSGLCRQAKYGTNEKSHLAVAVFMILGGEGGIRTHGTVTRTPDFESGTFDHSATSPESVLRGRVSEAAL